MKTRTFDPPLTYDEWSEAQPRGTVIMGIEEYRRDHDELTRLRELVADVKAYVAASKAHASSCVEDDCRLPDHVLSRALAMIRARIERHERGE